jgi:TRAP-type C4-dicarboxylate transport system permease small subunit
MMISILAGAIAAVSRDCHLNVEFVRHLLPDGVNRLFHVLGCLLMVVVLTAMGVVSAMIVNLLKGFDQRSDALEIPVWLVQSAVPVFMFIAAAMIAHRLFARKAKAPREEES